MPLRLLVVDDDPQLRMALAAFLADDDDLEVVATAGDADTAVALASLHRPDVVILDVRMPGGGGPVAARGIRAHSPGTRILVCSAYDDPGTVAEMRAAGADRYVAKGSGLLGLGEVVREVAGLPTG